MMSHELKWKRASLPYLGRSGSRLRCPSLEGIRLRCPSSCEGSSTWLWACLCHPYHSKSLLHAPCSKSFEVFDFPFCRGRTYRPCTRDLFLPPSLHPHSHRQNTHTASRHHQQALALRLRKGSKGAKLLLFSPWFQFVVFFNCLYLGPQATCYNYKVDN